MNMLEAQNTLVSILNPTVLTCPPPPSKAHRRDERQPAPTFLSCPRPFGRAARNEDVVCGARIHLQNCPNSDLQETEKMVNQGGSCGRGGRGSEVRQHGGGVGKMGDV